MNLELSHGIGRISVFAGDRQTSSFIAIEGNLFILTKSKIMILSTTSMTLTSLLALVTLSATAYQLSSQNQHQQASQQSAPNNSTNPYWRRPGCHQVGHTRTISIPGCVKFNLSTNACRGYCMSYSIPADHDIGPAASSELEIEQELKSSISSEVGGGSENALKDSDNSNSNNNNNNQPDTLKKNQRLNVDPSTNMGDKQGVRRGENQAKSTINNWSKSNENFPINDKLYLANQDQTLMAGGILTSGLGASAVKRDVISVSQCCNMMETEDVVVNLRCANGTRTYIFKSARSCECVFCKHL